MSQVEDKLKQMGHSLPPPPTPGGNYIPAVRTGNLVFLSGVTPRRPDGSPVAGKLGKDLTVEEGYEAARICGLNLLANLKQEIGDLDKVTHTLSQVEDKLKQMGHSLPPPPTPGGNYIPAVRTGNLVFLSGVTPRRPDGSPVAGKLGKDLTVEEGYEAARICGLNLLANLKQEIGDLDKVTHIVKLLGMVNSDPDFTQPPAVVNGCSDLVELYGDRGRHARSAVGMATLPAGVAVEIEMIAEVSG